MTMQPTMKHAYPVQLFARARDLAGSERVVIELPTGATVADLRRALAERYPPLAGFVDRCAVAVDTEFADDSQLLTPGAEVALLPPVSGGEAWCG
jgi:molybdopterin converting factor subunit 1